MLHATPLGDASDPDPYMGCLNNCDLVDPHAYATNDAYAAAYGACLRACDSAGGRYGYTDVTTTAPSGTTPNTFANLPGVLQPSAGYQPSPATNWYKVAGIAIIGLSALAAGLFYARAAHAS